MFTLAHITDLHMPPLPALQPHEITPKRILGYISWHRNRKRSYSADVLKILKTDIALHCVDHIAVTGDQTNLALDAEYERMAEWLKALAPVHDISVIPGNHDAYRYDHPQAFEKYWADFARDQKLPVQFPFVRKRDKVAIVGVSSAIKTPLFMAWGKVGEAQLHALEQTLSDLGAQGMFRVVMIHHPPQKGATQYRKSLLDGKAFRSVIERAGAELILHGHIHKDAKAVIHGPRDPVPVRCAACAGSNGKYGLQAAHYNLIKIAQEESRWAVSIEHRKIDMDRRVFVRSEFEELHLPKT